MRTTHPHQELTRLPLFTALDDCETVLLAGAGGGFDVYCAIPLLVALERRGKTVRLANYSFSNTARVEGRVTSIAAVHALEAPTTKLLACLGFGVDAFHGVCHAHFLEAVAALSRAGGYLGAFSLLPGMPEARAYLDLVDWVHDRHRHSIVNASVASAIEGAFGDVHRSDRTAGSMLFINPLMSMYFAFELGAVADRNLYLASLMNTSTLFEVNAIIEAFRMSGTQIKPRQTIPV